jgi:hypothetical protein
MLFCTQHHQSGGRKAQNCNSHAAAVDFFQCVRQQLQPAYKESLSALRNKYKNAGLRDAKCINCARTEQKAEAATHSLTRSSFCHCGLSGASTHIYTASHDLSHAPWCVSTRETEKSGRAGAEKVQPKKRLRGISWPGLFSTRISANNGMNISASVNVYDSFSVCGQLVVFN